MPRRVFMGGGPSLERIVLTRKTSRERTSAVYSTAAFSDVPHGGGESAIASLLTALEAVTDPRKRRGRMYGLTLVLAASLIAVLAGASNFRQVADHVADLPQSLLRQLGARWCHFRKEFAFPGERTIRRVLGATDADELDRAAGTWLRKLTR